MEELELQKARAFAGCCLLALVASSACSSVPQPPPAVKAPAPATPAAASPAPEAPVAGSVDPHRADVVVIDAGDPEASDGSTSLADTARAERQRRATAAKPVTVINDKNLKQHASKGQISIGAPGPAKPSTPAPPASAADAKGEEYWRSRVRDLRHRWKLAEEAAKRLSGEAEGLKRRFYSADDPYLRDSQIKPEWDRTLDLLRQARGDAKVLQRELEDVLEEGRQAGALPGWLREGIEEEPVQPAEEVPATQAIEPVELKEGRP
jgi:hypothetical protein